MLFLPELLMTVAALVWLAWIGRLLRVATGGFWRSGRPFPRAHDLTTSDVKLLRSLHIRP